MVIMFKKPAQLWKKSSKPAKLTLVFGIIWFLSILAFTAFAMAGEYILEGPAGYDFVLEEYLLLAIIAAVTVGSIAFLGFSMMLTSVVLKSSKKKPGKKNIFTFFINRFKFLVALALLPLIILLKIWRPLSLFKWLKKRTKISFKHLLKKTFKKIAITLPVLIFLLPIWIGGYYVAGAMTMEELNLVTDPISVAGTGSMYPTFPKGQGKTAQEQTQEIVDTPGMIRYPRGFHLFGRDFLSYTIKHGDIVSFYNEKTAEITEREYGTKHGFVKRVVALPGDMVEIRNGLLYLNGEPLLEQYIARARSTFGGEFLPDCIQLTVPENKLFVIGDNRKGSGDSRHELGMIDYFDVDHVIPYKTQEEGRLSWNWRDTAADLEESSKIHLEIKDYIELLNEARLEAGLKPLAHQEKLNESARLRAQKILEFDDFSFEATKSGYTMEKAMRDAGYYNIVWGEAPTSGYYDAEELLENQFAFPESKEFLLDAQFQEIGIAEFEGEINGCPTQVVIQHFAGYKPPNYSSDTIEAWEDVLSNLKDVQPSWNNLKNFGGFYSEHRDKIDRLTWIIDYRINKITDILDTMSTNKWFSTTQEYYVMTEDPNLYDEQAELVEYLNSR